MLSQPAWVTEESPKQREGVPALNVQSGEEEDKRKKMMKRHLSLSEILEAFTLRFLKQDPGHDPMLSWAGLSFGCAYRGAEGGFQGRGTSTRFISHACAYLASTAEHLGRGWHCQVRR